MPPDAPHAPPTDRDDEVDAVLEEFGGDARAAIAALLHDVDVLARDHCATVSFGFVRGDLFRVFRVRGRRSDQ